MTQKPAIPLRNSSGVAAVSSPQCERSAGGCAGPGQLSAHHTRGGPRSPGARRRPLPRLSPLHSGLRPGLRAPAFRPPAFPPPLAPARKETGELPPAPGGAPHCACAAPGAAPLRALRPRSRRCAGTGRCERARPAAWDWAAAAGQAEPARGGRERVTGKMSLCSVGSRAVGSRVKQQNLKIK